MRTCERFRFFLQRRRSGRSPRAFWAVSALLRPASTSMFECLVPQLQTFVSSPAEGGREVAARMAHAQGTPRGTTMQQWVWIASERMRRIVSGPVLEEAVRVSILLACRFFRRDDKPMRLSARRLSSGVARRTDARQPGHSQLSRPRTSTEALSYRALADNSRSPAYVAPIFRTNPRH